MKCGKCGRRAKALWDDLCGRCFIALKWEEAMLSDSLGDEGKRAVGIATASAEDQQLLLEQRA